MDQELQARSTSSPPVHMFPGLRTDPPTPLAWLCSQRSAWSYGPSASGSSWNTLWDEPTSRTFSRKNSVVRSPTPHLMAPGREAALLHAVGSSPGLYTEAPPSSRLSTPQLMAGLCQGTFGEGGGDTTHLPEGVPPSPRLVGRRSCSFEGTTLLAHLSCSHPLLAQKLKTLLWSTLWCVHVCVCVSSLCVRW